MRCLSGPNWCHVNAFTHHHGIITFIRCLIEYYDPSHRGICATTECFHQPQIITFVIHSYAFRFQLVTSRALLRYCVRCHSDKRRTLVGHQLQYPMEAKKERKKMLPWPADYASDTFWIECGQVCWLWLKPNILKVFVILRQLFILVHSNYNMHEYMFKGFKQDPNNCFTIPIYVSTICNFSV